MIKRILLLLTVILMTSTFQVLNAQSDGSTFWMYETNPKLRKSKNRILKKTPISYSKLKLNYDSWKNELRKVNEQQTVASNQEGFLIQLPTPTGSFKEYYIFENSVIAPEVAHLYTVKTYKGYSNDKPNRIIRCSISETAFNAFIYDGDESYTIEPIEKGNNTLYIVYYKNELPAPKLKCGHTGHKVHGGTNFELTNRTPASLRTYKLAYVASGEFSQQWGGAPYNVTDVLNTIATGLNMVNPIYERDLGVTFTSVTTSSLVFPDPATDPFDLSNQGALIEQNHIECVNTLGVSNFDVGHLLVWANTGGLASPGACDNNFKGEGFSGSNSSLSSIFIDYSGHEIGHQFGGEHNFVSQECGTSAAAFRFEPGEGSSIMSYAGVCDAPASYQNESDPFFHSASINSINTYITTNATCHTSSTPGGGNSAAPVPNAQSDITIPKQTPFVLVGSVTDVNDAVGNITLLWEQNDGGGAAAVGSPNCMTTTQPLFKYIDPVNDDFRIFPEVSEVLAGNNNGAAWEKLPCTARTINFNLIARDNNTNWGRTGNDQMVVTVANTGPFAVTAPNGGETWNEGSTQTISWSENGTSSHCANVDILLSTDNGSTFSVVATAVTNDGSHDITIPAGLSTSARVLVQCSVGGNFKSASTFFDISDAVFNIEMSLPVELVDFKVERYSDDKVNILWTTANEINSSHFEVERSRNGYNYEVIGTINSTGNSFTLQNYKMLDNAPFQGTNYYRLVQVDLDGTVEYSPIRAINFSNSSKKIFIYPNPAKDYITIQTSSKKPATTIKIHDQLGRLVQEALVLESSIDVSGLPNGVYYVTIKSEQETFVEKVSIRK